MRKLIFATNNRNKVKEIAALASDQVDIQTLADIGFEGDIEETGSTLIENARIKCRHIVRLYHTDCVADDSGLVVEALNGEPGVYSARYAGEPKDDARNTALLLERLGANPHRNASFLTILCLSIDGREHLFTGELNGTITREPTGTNGFGYDPVFVPEGESRTLAEMSLEEKNKISHRARAFRQMAEFLKSI